MANINAIKSGVLESGFSQSDVAYWAYTGTGIYEGKGAVEDLRALASLYPETIHLVARKGAGIKSVKDLKGKRVSLDEPGSGTLVDARIILEAYGLSEKDIDADFIKPNPSIDKIKDNQLDAFFIVAGYPIGSVIELASSVGAEHVPINGPEADAVIEKFGLDNSSKTLSNQYEPRVKYPDLVRELLDKYSDGLGGPVVWLTEEARDEFLDSFPASADRFLKEIRPVKT